MMRTFSPAARDFAAAARTAAVAGLALLAGCAPALPFGGAGPQVAAETTPHWSYSGSNGPEHWSELEPDFDLCHTGKQQSPIDITRSKLLKADWLLPLQVKLNPTKANIVNNGHTIQVNYDPGSLLDFEKTTYQLRQFHFHSPSEHKVSGVGAEMEMHLVFSDTQKHLAVIGVLIDQGAENPLFAKFWHALPDKEGAVTREITLNASDGLPVDRDYFTYDGSLTTPPCTEGVTWIVLKQHATASADQIARFRALFSEPTARPLQAINDRLVKDEAQNSGTPGSTPGASGEGAASAAH